MSQERGELTQDPYALRDRLDEIRKGMEEERRAEVPAVDEIYLLLAESKRLDDELGLRISTGTRWELVGTMVEMGNTILAQSDFLDKALVLAENNWEERRELYYWTRGGDVFFYTSDQTQSKWRGIIESDLQMEDDDYERLNLKNRLLENGFALWAGDGAYGVVKQIAQQIPTGERSDQANMKQWLMFLARNVMADMMTSKVRHGETGWVLGEMDELEGPMWMGAGALNHSIWLRMMEEFAMGGYGNADAGQRNQLVDKLLADNLPKDDDYRMYMWVLWHDLRPDLLVRGVRLLADTMREREQFGPWGPRVVDSLAGQLVMAIAAGGGTDFYLCGVANSDGPVVALGGYDLEVVTAARQYLQAVRDKKFVPAGTLMARNSLANILMEKETSLLVGRWLAAMAAPGFSYDSSRFFQDYLNVTCEGMHAATVVDILLAGMEQEEKNYWLPKLVDVYLKSPKMDLGDWYELIGTVRLAEDREKEWKDLGLPNGREPGNSWTDYQRMMRGMPSLGTNRGRGQ